MEPYILNGADIKVEKIDLKAANDSMRIVLKIKNQKSYAYGKFVNVKDGKLTIFDLESGYNKKVLRVINLVTIYEAYKILYIKTDVDKLINLQSL